MNRKIDLAVALFVLLASCFAALLVVTGSLEWAMVLTYAAGVLTRYIYLKWRAFFGLKRGEKKKRAKMARELVDSWAFKPDEETALKYVSSVNDVSNCAFKLYPCHIWAQAFGVNELLNAWRSFPENDRLIVAVTCDVDNKAMSIAKALESPKVCLLDAEALSRIIAQSPLPIKSVSRTKKIKAIKPRVERKNAPRLIMYAFSSILLYAVTGRLVYLLSAMALLFFAFLGLVRKPKPKTLFETR